jgi:phosphopantothenoylcysteine decarboxylase
MSEKSPKKKHFNLLIGITGSVASIKLEELLNEIVDTFLKSYASVLDYKLNICIIPTKNAKNFIENFDSKFNKNALNLTERLSYLRETLNGSSKSVTFSFSDEDEWSSWSKRDDPVLHIELRKWADLLLIAPLDANSLVRIKNM